MIGFDPPGVETVDLLIQDGVVAARSRSVAAPAGAEIVDATGLLVVPGLADAWTQLTADPLGGLHADGPAREAADRSLLRAHTEESLICAAFTAGIRALRSGVTGVLEIVDAPSLPDQALDRVRDVLLTLGFRCVLAPRVGDEDGPDALEAALATAGAAARFGGGELYRMAVGVGSLATLPDRALESIAALAGANGTPVLVEAGIHAQEDARCRRSFGASPAERLIRAGLAGPGLVVRAGAALGAAEIEALRERGVVFVTCPGSDLRHGRSPLPWDAADAVGTAEGPPDVLAELQLFGAITAGRGAEMDPSRSASLLAGSRRLLGRLSGAALGDLAVGAPADLALWPAHQAWPLNGVTLGHQLLHGLGGARPRSVMVQGRFLLRDGVVAAIDADEISHLSRRGALDLWTRLRGSAFPGWAPVESEAAPEAAAAATAAFAIPAAEEEPPAGLEEEFAEIADDDDLEDEGDEAFDDEGDEDDEDGDFDSDEDEGEDDGDGEDEDEDESENESEDEPDAVDVADDEDDGEDEEDDEADAEGEDRAIAWDERDGGRQDHDDPDDEGPSGSDADESEEDDEPGRGGFGEGVFN